ncbi:AMP-binding protein [Hyphomonas sp.]|uniref:AMP-binding protein n=1 Tax=Hyphomonas sp. TaxID=87 RepID=UPI00391DF333
MSALERPQHQPQRAAPHRKWFNPEAAAFEDGLQDFTPERIEDIVCAGAGLFGNSPFLTTVLPNGMSATLSFKQVEQQSGYLARYFRETLNLAPGTVVAVQSPNCISYVVCLLGILRAGLVLSNVNPLYTEAETRRQLRDCRARVLIGSTLFADTIERAVEGTEVQHVISVSLTDFFPAFQRAGLDFLLSKVKRMARPLEIRHVKMQEALSVGAQYGWPVEQYTSRLPSGRDTVYQYSGGTTGTSKGVRLSEANLITNIDQFVALAPGLKDLRGETMLLVLPVYHVFGLFASIIALRNGVHVVLAPSPRPLSNLKKAFEKFRPRLFPGVNTLFSKLMEEPWFKASPPELMLTISGAAALDPQIGQRWQEMTGSEIIEGYGMTEATTLLAINPPDARKRPGYAGLPLPGTEIAILRDDGSFADAGEVGEIVARGPQLMSGYLHRPDETNAAYLNGWMRTGDIGVLDTDGYLKIVDRAKDMVLVGGFNVFPNEVDEVLNACPGVLEAASAGIPVGGSEEELHAFVVRRDPSLTAADVMAHCSQHLTGYKRPRKIHFVDELPKSPIGKILRRELRVMVAKPAA